MTAGPEERAHSGVLLQALYFLLLLFALLSERLITAAHFMCFAT